MTTVCVRCVMDGSDPDLDLDASGTCSLCRAFDELVAPRLAAADTSGASLRALADRIRAEGRDRDYDCVLGLSGGVDSSYVTFLAKQLDLRPLIVHFDNGWNSELAVQNIHKLVSDLGFDLDTHVVDWDEFADLQRSYFRASVVDIEVPTDHAINALVHHVAVREGVKYILTGNNTRTEFGMPPTWSHRKSDLRNLRAIHGRFGTRPLETFPQASTLQLLRWQYLRGIRSIDVLDHVQYDKSEAIATLERELGWQYYGGKHYESFFTRFYQAHVLPQKFGIDKRRAHLSALIRVGQRTRDEALAELELPLYDPKVLANDRAYVLKKLGFSEEEWETIMSAPRRSHLDFPSDERYIAPLLTIKRTGRQLRRVLRRSTSA